MRRACHDFLWHIPNKRCGSTALKTIRLTTYGISTDPVSHLLLIQVTSPMTTPCATQHCCDAVALQAMSGHGSGTVLHLYEYTTTFPTL